MNGELEKLIIASFKDAKYESKDQEYTTLINPDSIVLDSKVEYETPPANGGSGGEKKFLGMSNPSLSLQLLFDGTGVLPSPILKEFSLATFKAANVQSVDDKKLSSVSQQINAFKKVAYDYRGTLHETPYVHVIWGELLFKGRLETLKISYTLFARDGSPLRALADVTFIYCIDPATQNNENNENSPDLTHVRTVNEGETLPLMCEQIYNDPKLYLEIARVNGLSNYRKLPVGSKLFFPPINNQA